MKAAELKVVEEAKRTADVRFQQYYKVMGSPDSRTPTGDSQKRRPEPTKAKK